MRSLSSLSTACAGLLLAALAGMADTVETRDGSRLNGEIVKLHDGILSLETSFAGTLEIPFEEIVSFSSEDPEQVRFSDGSVAVGPVRSSGGRITVAASGGSLTGETSSVAAVWGPEARDPAAVAREAALEAQLRSWSYEAAVGLTGRTGNTDRNDFLASFSAVLEGPSDRLRFYGGWQYAEAGEVRTADELIGGVSYTNFFAEHFGWYVREELERDIFENIDFRSTTAAGLNYRVFNEETHSLEFTAGLALRYESYSSGGSESFPGLDFGLKHYWKFAEWGEMNNSVTYNPAFEDFGDYRVDHISTVDMPLGSSDFWKLRLSLQNQYSSDVPANAEELDTTYALSLLLNWQ